MISMYFTGSSKHTPAKAPLQEALQESSPPSQDKLQYAERNQQADIQATAPLPQPLSHSPAKSTMSAEVQEEALDKDSDKEDSYKSPDWDPQLLDLLGEKLTTAERKQLQALDEENDQPGYMQKVDLLVASMFIRHGIATHDQLFKGAIIYSCVLPSTLAACMSLLVQ